MCVIYHWIRPICHRYQMGVCALVSFSPLFSAYIDCAHPNSASALQGKHIKKKKKKMSTLTMRNNFYFIGFDGCVSACAFSVRMAFLPKWRKLVQAINYARTTDNQINRKGDEKPIRVKKKMLLCTWSHMHNSIKIYFYIHKKYVCSKNTITARHQLSIQ